MLWWCLPLWIKPDTHLQSKTTSVRRWCTEALGITPNEAVCKNTRRQPTITHPSLTGPILCVSGCFIPVTYLAADSKILSWFIIHTDSVHYLWTFWTVCCVIFSSMPPTLLLPDTTPCPRVSGKLLISLAFEMTSPINHHHMFCF